MTKTKKIKEIVLSENSIESMRLKIESIGVRFVSFFIVGKNGVNPRSCKDEDRFGFCKVGLGSKTVGFYFDQSLFQNGVSV